MISLPTLLQKPELIIGLVAPIGVDLDNVTSALSSKLKAFGYNPFEFKVTRLMREIDLHRQIAETPFIRSYTDRIAYANEIRSKLGDDALAALCIAANRRYRYEHNRSRPEHEFEQREDYAPLPGFAYILRQLKRPEEVVLLRRVYGRQFFLLSAFSPPDKRKIVIASKERKSTRSRTSKVHCENLANELVEQDSKEAASVHGQNVRDAFPLADVFIDATSKAIAEEQVERFVNLLFGNNYITPTRSEYGMYLAKSASLRSSDLSRQVGAAIFLKSGEIASLGANEVPRAGGGSYWANEVPDFRDHVNGYDPNDQRQSEILVNLMEKLKDQSALSNTLLSVEDPAEIARRVSLPGQNSVGNSMLMDLLEFGRVIHAEMSAILDSARRGLALKHSTLYCTTFPCHMCAKHIVAAGIDRVVYLEPYPKSYAADLHSDSIGVDCKTPDTVLFETFIGISPQRYRDLFERRGKRKDESGNAKEWLDGAPRPNIDMYYEGYLRAEEHFAVGFTESINTNVIETTLVLRGAAGAERSSP